MAIASWSFVSKAASRPVAAGRARPLRESRRTFSRGRATGVAPGVAMGVAAGDASGRATGVPTVETTVDPVNVIR